MYVGVVRGARLWGPRRVSESGVTLRYIDPYASLDAQKWSAKTKSGFFRIRSPAAEPVSEPAACGSA